MLNPLAQELNETLRGSVVEALMSDMGKRMYFPNGIISQGGEAAKDAYFANGTIGMAVAEKTPIELDSYKKIMPDLNPRETVAYEKTAGNPELRKIWKDKLLELGCFSGFRKNKLGDATDNEYVKRFILECNYGVLIHIFCVIFGFSVILAYPLNFWYCFGFPVAIVNAFLNLLTLFVLRYNLPKLHLLYRYNLRKEARLNN